MIERLRGSRKTSAIVRIDIIGRWRISTRSIERRYRGLLMRLWLLLTRPLES